MWVFPLLLIVPNVWLDFSETYSVLSKLTNLALPLGIYYLLMGFWRRSGLTALLMLPVAFFCAFQIVLLNLYGESIIAVDMFMNVATTNVSEATELLGNLSVAIISVLVLYLPPLALGIYLLCKRRYASPASRKPILIVGGALALTGIVCMIAAYASRIDYHARRELFPVNVVCNLVESVHRIEQAKSYDATSADFRYHARDLRSDSDVPEVYVLVVGETSRADNWQLFGYERPTNPRLSQRDGLLAYGRTLSESNTTHKSVPMLLSNLTADNFGDSVYRVKSIFDAFNEAGAHTVFIANQQPNRSYIDFFADQANEHRRICSGGNVRYDHELLAVLDSCLNGEDCRKLFVTLHTYGSHYCYHERYTPEYRRFTPDDATDASLPNRPDLINAYDNTIIYADALLDSVIDLLDSRHVRSVMVYTSDHGEDIFDDARGRFLHASPTPTYWQLHVPMLMWMSPEFRRAYPALYAAAEQNCRKAVSSTASVFDTLLDLAGIAADSHRSESSLCNHAYREPRRRYLNDFNEGVALSRSGLRQPDFELLSQLDP